MTIQQSLLAAIRTLSPLQDSAFARLLGGAVVREWAIGDQLFRAGRRCGGVWFVGRGALGLYRLTEDGREAYQDFFLEHTFATDITALTSQQPADTSLVALEPCETIYISREFLLRMYDVSEEFQAFGRHLLEHLLVARTEYSVRQANLSARARYAYLRDQQPELLQRIPLQHLSSYLGMSRETLSRIRRND